MRQIFGGLRAGSLRLIFTLMAIAGIGIWATTSNKLSNLAAAATPRQTGAALPTLQYQVSAIGNSLPNPQRHMQNAIDSIAVTPKGNVYCNTVWETGGQEAGIYQQGQYQGQAVATHGGGAFGGHAVTFNNKYLFVSGELNGTQFAASNSHGIGPASNAKTQTDYAWFGFSRYYLNGAAASFTNGAGTTQAFKCVNQVTSMISGTPTNIDAQIQDLAADNTHVYVSNPFTNEIMIFDANHLMLLNRWPVSRPSRIVLDHSNTLWILQSGTNKILHYSTNGTKLPQVITNVTAPTALAVDSQNHLLVADGGPNQQIYIYPNASKAPSLFTVFGAQGGIYTSAPASRGNAALAIGDAGPLRFNAITGLGMDGSDNIYVAYANAINNAVLESYTSDGTRLWQLQGLCGADCADADPQSANNGDVYTWSNHFLVDYTNPASLQWSYQSHTINRFKYPNDPRLNQMGGQPVIRWISGKKFMFLTSGPVAIFRFNDATDGDVAIPCGLLVDHTPTILSTDQKTQIPAANPLWPANQPAATGYFADWIWRDQNGNGDFDDGEYQTNPSPADAPVNFSINVDQNGDIWKITETNSIIHFPVQGLDSNGSPIYTYATSKVLTAPAPFADSNAQAEHIEYDPTTDAMWISGYTAQYPQSTEPSTPGGIGRVIACYDHWSTSKTIRYQIVLPYQSSNLDAGTTQNVGTPCVISLAGDRIFVGYMQTSSVRVYGKTAGDYQGTMVPPSNLWNGAWIDTSNGMHAIQRPTGDYVVFMQEEVGAKVLVWTLPATTGSANPNAVVANTARYIAPSQSNSNATQNETAFQHGYQPWIRQDNITLPSTVPVETVSTTTPASTSIVTTPVTPTPVTTIPQTTPVTPAPTPVVQPVTPPVTTPVVAVTPATTPPATQPVLITHNVTPASTFSYTQLFVGNTNGTVPTHVQSNITAMAASQNGTVLGTCNWDEGGGEGSLYKAGQVLGHCTQVHGSASGITCAINNTYGFIPTFIPPTAGYPGQYPDAGKIWFGIARIGATNGNVWPFPGGKGFTGILGTGWFMKFAEVNSTSSAPINPIRDNPIISMAASETNLFAYASGVLYNITPDTMTIIKQINLPLTNVGPMAVNPITNDVWITQGATGARFVAGYTSAGVPLGKQFPAPARTTGIALSPDGTVLNMADGYNDNIKQVTIATGAVTTFGSSTRNFNGTMAPGRFEGIIGMGVDGSGNVYVGENRNLLTTKVSALSGPNTLLWSLYSNGSEMVPEGDASADTSIFSHCSRYTFDYTSGAMNEAAVTTDPVRFPDDIPLRISSGVMHVRTIQGKKFVYSAIGGTMICWRQEANSEILIPSAIIAAQNAPFAATGGYTNWPTNKPASGSWICRDSGGNGQLNAGTFEAAPLLTDNVNAPWVDKNGDIWMMQQFNGVVHIKCMGLDANGVPIYNAANTTVTPMMAPFIEAMRCVYESDTDTMWISGWTKANGIAAASMPVIGAQGGAVMIRYDNWSTTRTQGLQIVYPYNPAYPYDIIRAVAVSPTKVYALHFTAEWIEVYDRNTGAQLGTIKPTLQSYLYDPTTAGNPVTGGPWADIPAGLVVWTRADGTDVLSCDSSIGAFQWLYKVSP